MDDEKPCLFAASGSLLRLLGLQPTPKMIRSREIATFGGLKVPVMKFSADVTDAMRSRTASRGQKLETVPCDMGAGRILLVTAKAPTVESVHLDKELGIDRAGEEGFETMLAGDLMFLEMFSRATGMRVRYCHNGNLIQPPIPAPDDTIVLFAHARPPGFVTHTDLGVKTLHGLSLWKDGETRYVRYPTRGRGRVVEADGTPAFQVLGNNYYQVCLTHSEVHHPFNRAVVFSLLLGDIMKDLDALAEGEVDGLSEERGRKAFVAFAETQATKQLTRLRKEVAKEQLLIDTLQDELAKMLQKQRDLAIQMNALANSTFQEELRKRLPKELADLKRIPGYVDVAIVDDGVHLTTECITLEHEGQRYPMGVFTVRLDPQSGKVDVWTDAPLHPDGHHHPHVERRSLACYGNVTLAILKSMAAYRYKDAAETVIHWLRSYNAATTLYPITEWPVETKKEESHDAVVAA